MLTEYYQCDKCEGLEEPCVFRTQQKGEPPFMCAFGVRADWKKKYEPNIHCGNCAVEERWRDTAESCKNCEDGSQWR